MSKQLEEEVASLRARVAEQSAVIAKLVAYTAPLWPAYPPPVYIHVPCGRPHADEPWRVTHIPYWQILPVTPYPPYQPYQSEWLDQPWCGQAIVGNVIPGANAGCAANPMLGAEVVTFGTVVGHGYAGNGACAPAFGGTVMSLDWSGPYTATSVVASGVSSTASH